MTTRNPTYDGPMGIFSDMGEEITPTHKMNQEAEKLKTGKILFAYKDGNNICMETSRGKNPYVWQNDSWVTMRR